MSEENNLKDTLREYYDSKQYSFDENEWERAYIQINAAKRSRKLRKVAYFSISLLVALFAGVFAISNVEEEKNSELKTLNTTISNLTIPKPQEEIVPSNEKEIEKKPRTKKKDVKAPTIQNPETTIKSATPTEKEILVKPSANNPSHENLPSPSLKKTQETRMETYAENPSVENLASTNTEIEKEPSNEDPQIKFPETETQQRKNPEKNSTESLQTTEELSSVNLSIEGASTIEIKKVAVNESTSNQTDTISKKPQSKDESKKIVNEDSFNQLEMDSLYLNQDSTTKKRLSYEGLYYEAGLAWLYGWKGQESHDARGFSPVVGIHYMNSLSNKYSLSFGVQYLLVHNLSSSSKTSRISDYGYGEQSKVTTITPTAAHYLVAPFRLHYYLDQKNSFGVGINLAYLLNVDVQVESYDEQLGSKVNYSSTKLSGYTEGFNWYDSQFMCFYRRCFLTDFAIHAEFFYGLSDVKQNDFFKLNYKERNSGLKLTLIYYTSRKNKK